MTGEVDDWGRQSEEHRARIIVDNALMLMHQTTFRSDFPPELSQYFPAFRESVKMLPTPLFKQAMLEFHGGKVHPAVIPGIKLGYERSPRHAFVLHQTPETWQVIVDQGYVGSFDGRFMTHELLAEEWGHAATKVYKKIPVASVRQDSWQLYTYEIGLELLRDIENIPTYNPPWLLVQGFKSMLADDQYAYLTLPGTYVFEEMRAQLIAKYIAATMLASQNQKTTAEGIRDVELQAKVLGAKKDVLLMKMGKSLKWKDLIPACVNFDIDEFVAFANYQMGFNPFYKLFEQIVAQEFG